MSKERYLSDAELLYKASCLGNSSSEEECYDSDKDKEYHPSETDSEGKLT